MSKKENTDYENCIGVKEDDHIPRLPIDSAPSEEKEWKKNWVGMPEFEQEDNPPYKKLIVSFRTKKDYEEFAKLIDQNLTEKTKSIWHPHLDRDANSLKRWLEIV